MAVYAKRVDVNQRKIVKTFRSLGATVLILSSVGSGCPDLLIAYNNFNVLVECKDGKKPPSSRVLTPDQIKFFKEWRGAVIVIKSIEEAIALIKLLRKKYAIQPIPQSGCDISGD